MKKLSVLLAVLCTLLSCAMCAVVAYQYRDMLCAIEHAGASAPASVALLSALWFLPFVLASAVGAVICYKKSRKGE